MVDSSWDDVERPILEAVVEHYQDAGAVQNIDVIAERTGLDRGLVGRAVRNLVQAEHLWAHDTTNFDGAPNFANIEPLPPALRAVGAWPVG